MTDAAMPDRMLGVDVGERRIGIAVSAGLVAVPLTIIDHTDRDADLERVLALVTNEQASRIVVGLPLAREGEEGEQARLTRRFGEQLAERAGVPVVYQDERLTSVDATAASVASGRRTRRRGQKTHVDDLAAAAILQRYIDNWERQ